MRILVDTHCWLWALARPDALNAEAVAILSDANTEVVFSAASIWEIAIKVSLGKLRLAQANDVSLFDMIESQSFTQLSIAHAHARHVVSLPWHHRDPFDRMLIAQAQIEDLPVMTADNEFLRYDIEVIWAGLRRPRKRRTRKTR